MEKALYASQVLSMPAGDSRYCVPVALALVTGKTAREIDASLKAKGFRKTGHGVHQIHWLKELTDMGVTYTDVTEKYTTKHQGVGVKTLATRLDPSRKYLVTIRSHLLAVVHGNVEDWSAGRRHHVKKIFEISENGVAVSDHTPKVPSGRNVDALNGFRDQVKTIVNPEGTHWPSQYDSKVSGSWVKFHRDWTCGFSFLIGQAKNGMFKLALQEDKNSTRSLCTDDVARAVGRIGQESKSYASWILTEAELGQAVAAIRNEGSR